MSSGERETQYFRVEFENGVQALPIITDNGHCAGRCFEEAHAGRVARGNHVGPRDVQSKALGVVEGAVLRGRQMLYIPDVCGHLFR